MTIQRSLVSRPRLAIALVAVAFVAPCGGFSARVHTSVTPAARHAGRRPHEIRAILVPSPFSFPHYASRFGDADVDFSTALTDFGLGLKSTGTVTIEAPLSFVWDVVTDYERHPEFIPNIVASKVERVGSQKVLNQRGLLSNKLQLKVDLRLAVTEIHHTELKLKRISGHGIMEFVARYQFRRIDNNSCRLSYDVQVVPFPIFPMPIVQHKVRKEVPRMLSAMRAKAIERFGLAAEQAAA